MIEVEAKIRISSKQELDKFRSLARKLGKYVGRIDKIDEYYTLQSLKEYPKKSLRIRRFGRVHIVNFKQRISYVDGIYAKNETEFQVSDISGFLRLIKDFGFKHWLTKEKTTELYRIKPNLHIEINNVKHLGWFVEVEYIARRHEIRRARSEVHALVRKLGAKKREIIKTGYTKILWDKGEMGSEKKK